MVVGETESKQQLDLTVPFRQRPFHPRGGGEVRKRANHTVRARVCGLIHTYNLVFIMFKLRLLAGTCTEGAFVGRAKRFETANGSE